VLIPASIGTRGGKSNSPIAPLRDSLSSAPKLTLVERCCTSDTPAGIQRFTDRGPGNAGPQRVRGADRSSVPDSAAEGLLASRAFHFRLDSDLVDQLERFRTKSEIGTNISQTIRLLIAIGLRDVVNIDMVWAQRAWKEGFSAGYAAFTQKLQQGTVPPEVPPR
jgi:hypothetical protein